jgi:hypothetical protein
VDQLKTDLGKHFKYVQFLFQVYNSKVDSAKLAVVFQKCGQAVDEAAELGAKTLDLKTDETNCEYYQAVIEFLTAFKLDKNSLQIAMNAKMRIA